MNLENLIEKKRLIICCGSGGVGKTTMAAALALKATLMGKTVVVLTIDPARRLANSLGLKNLGNEEKEIPFSEFEKANLKPKGKMFALMMDTKRTFDKIIEKYAPSEESKQAIFNNTLYQHLSGMIAGSQEYMAMEKVYELYQNDKFDLIVLDTPPTQHALDFLDAPQKMTQAVSDSILKWFLKPSLFLGRASLKFIEKSTRTIFKTFDHVMGFDFMQDLSAMLISTAGLLEGFKERAQEVSDLLHQPKTAFLLVTAPQGMVVPEALFFHEKIKEYKLPFAGFIVNRVYPSLNFKSNKEELKKKMRKADLTAKEVETLSDILEKYQCLVDQDQEHLDLLEERLKKKESITLIPYLDSDVHDLAGLAKIGEYLV